MPQEIIIPLLINRSGGINSGFSELSDDDFCRRAAAHLAERDNLERLLRECDSDARSVALEFGKRFKLWGVSLSILRRELKMRGFGV